MDPRELKDKATEFFSKGKFAKSAETYELYCKADPKDLQARLRMGDAWSKSGKKDRAIIAYQAAAEGFAKDGFLPRAIAASKLVLELDPAHKGIAQMLADLYARKSGSSRPSTARTIGAKPDPVVAKAEPSPTNRADAIEISVEDDVPVAVARPAPAAPSPTNRADAIEIAIEEDRPEDAKAPPEPLNSGDGIEIELSTQSVTGEIDVPIVGIDLTPAPGELPAELDLPPPPPPEAPSYELEISEPAGASFELDPPPAPDFELHDVVEASPPPPPVVPPPRPPVALDPKPPEVVRAPAAVPPAPPREDRAPVAPAEVLRAPAPPRDDARAAVALDPPPEVSRAPAVVPPPPPREDARPPVAPAPVAPVALPPPPPREDASAPAPVAALPVPPSEDDVVVLTRKRVEPPITSSPSGSSTAPPGLKPKRPEAAEPPKSAPAGARIWLPPTFQPPVAAPGSTDAPTTAPAQRIEATSAQTELERSLEVFAQFDVDASRPAAKAQAPAKPSTPQAQRTPIVASFTELELEGDSLLQAVEAAAALGIGAPKSSPSVSIAAEEIMDAPDDLKPEPGALPKIPLFSDLPEDAFIALLERCPLRRAEPGDRIFEQGSQGTSFFVVCAGKVRVMRTDGEATRELAVLEEGAFFGEMALLSDAPRSASVEAAAEDTQLLEIPAIVLTDLSSQHPTVATALKKFCRQRLLANLMNSASLFKPFTKTERRDLVQRFRARDAIAGEVLIQEGRPSDGLYVVLTGEVAVVMGNRQVATLREGQVFGEMSLLTRSPTSATVKTTRRTSFLRLPREDFDELIMSHPQILEQVAELTDERRKQNAALQARPDATSDMV